MKVTLNWLKEFVDIKLSAQELAHRLTHAGLEVESVQSVGEVPDSIITVKIVKMNKHPNADRLTLCEVSLGDETRNIVCGAKNMKEGDVVALAVPGTLLPDGKKIERSAIRGVTSEGMLCSERELGFSPEAEGLMILPPETPLGKPLTQALPVADTVFDINVTPNRPDCLSVQGLAREAAAVTGAAFRPLSPKPIAGHFSTEGLLRVEVRDPELCPRYTARMIRGARVGPSPFLVRERLKNVGVRSINNVVDATNYVMMETGQPLHAFDAARIAGKTIRILRPPSGEKFQTLDEIERHLGSEDLIIADSEKILAIAGVMGGLHSGVTDGTEILVLESAYFQPASVRRTSKKLGLMTESSYRFERGVDPNGVRTASDRLTELILQWAGGEASSETIDVRQGDFPSQKVALRRSRARTVLGVDFEANKIESVLSRLQLNPRKKNDDQWECAIPTFRRDLTREIDLIEETARILGYQDIPTAQPSGFIHPARDDSENPRERQTKQYLSDRGFLEAIHYSFGSEKEILKTGLETKDLIRISNPLSEDLEVMRPSLIPSLLRCVQWNLARQNDDLRLYEVRTVYRKGSSGDIEETRSLGLALTGLRHGKHWSSPREDVDFYDLKGLMEGLWKRLHLPAFELVPSRRPFLHPGMSAELRVGDISLGDFGVLHPQTASNFELAVPVVLGEFHLSRLYALPSPEIRLTPLPKYPSVERDLTLVADEDLTGESVIREIMALKLPAVREVRLFDVYRGKPIQEGKKALTYSIRYQDDDRTLTDAEVNQTHTQLVEKLKTLLPIEWR
jgi:phenylalanyl-tRNA synthetase beta chain